MFSSTQMKLTASLDGCLGPGILGRFHDHKNVQIRVNWHQAFVSGVKFTTPVRRNTQSFPMVPSFLSRSNSAHNAYMAQLRRKL